MGIASIAPSTDAVSQNFDYKITAFVRRASILKNKFRGKAQYVFARNEARRFLESEVPKTNINTWLEQTCNAIALSQLLRFFEVQPDMALLSLLLNKLVRTAEDAKASPVERLEATLALMVTRPEENYERSFATVEVVLKAHQDRLAGKADAATAGAADGKNAGMRAAWHVLDLCAKVLQQCGKRVPIALNDRLTQTVVMLLQTTEEQDLVSLKSSLLRIYAWMVRAEREEARNILGVIVHGPQYLKAYDFAALMQSCSQHHQLHFLPIELIKRLIRTSLEYTLSANGRDASIILSSIVHIISTLQPGINEVTEIDIRGLYDVFTALLEDYQPRVLRFMDKKDEFYWKNPGDITTIVFAYELGGRLRHHPIFDMYDEYVAREVSALEPTQLAMATGILRRADRLTQEMSAKLSERIETLLGEMKLSELSHICATFASLPTPPNWMHEAKVVALRLLRAEATGLTRLNLAIAFPDDKHFISQVDYSQLSGSQLVDTLPLVLGNAVFEGPVVAALVTRLTEAKERFSPDDARVLLNCGRPVLVNAINYYLYQRLSEPKWDTSILYCLPLVANKGGPAEDPSKALEAAKQVSISPEQFVSLVELLTSVFGESHADINTFVKVGGKDLITVHSVLLQSVVRYLAAVRPFSGLHPDFKWLELLTEKMATRFSPLKLDELESFLVSLRTIYTNVNKTPVLHMLLSDLVENYYSKGFNEPNVQAARITVLLVYMQNGMSLPLLTDQSPQVKAVQQNSAGYPEDVKEVVATMPLPAATHPKTNLGRFTLKLILTEPPHDASPVLHGSDAEDAFHHEGLSIAYGLGESTSAPPELADKKPYGKVEENYPTVLEGTAAGVTPPGDNSGSESHEMAPVPLVATPSGVSASPALNPTTYKQSHTSHAAEGPTSYYAKFFSSSVGQIFRGRGRVDSMSEEEHLQPRRTNLQAHVHRQVLDTSSPTEPFSGWGTPPPLQQPPSENHWRLTPPTPVVGAADNNVSHAAKPLGMPPATAFSSLFSATEARPMTFSMIEETPLHGEASLARPPGPVGNHVYISPLAQQRNRPVMTKKAVVGRVGKPTDLGLPIEKGIYSAAVREPRDTTPGIHPAVAADVVLEASATPHAKAGGVDFMQRAGLAKISGYNVQTSEGGHVQGQYATPSVDPPPASAKSDTSSNPLAWQEAARRVARISRHAKTKDKTRGQQSLSEWLSSPAKRLSNADETTSVVAPDTPGRKRKGSKSGEHGKESYNASETNHSVGAVSGNARRKAAAAATTGVTRSRGGRGSPSNSKSKAQAPVAKADTKKKTTVNSYQKANAVVGRKKSSNPPSKRGSSAAIKTKQPKKAASKKPSPRKEPTVRKITRVGRR